MPGRDRTVCVVGAGHIGLPLAALLAESGFQVTGYDTNEDFISRVSTTGQAGFSEEELDDLLVRNLNRRLRLTSSPPPAQDVYVITVGTPLDPATGRPDLDRIRHAIGEIGPRLRADPLVILRSTVTIGTTRDVVLPEMRRYRSAFGLAFCPERTIEGKAIPEMRTLPQIIGGLDQASGDRAAALFGAITRRIVRVSSLEAAEAVKLINNAYRDTTFAFANEVALLAEALGLSGRELIEAANADYPRASIPSPGFVGGPCLGKDAVILIESLRPSGRAAQIVGAARSVNGSLPEHVAERVLRQLRDSGRRLQDARVMLSGFGFKGSPPTEDVRGTPAVPVLRRLQAEGVEVWGHDFLVPEKVIVDFGARACTLADGFDGADGAIIMNNHPRYREIDIVDLVRRMRRPSVLFDSWGLFRPEMFRGMPELQYGSLGSAFTHA